MEERSKTNKEIFEQKYPLEKVLSSSLLCVEAIGYLKALTQYFPSEQNWADTKMVELMLIVISCEI